MRSDTHVRAQLLIEEALAGEPRGSDERWLREHLRDCPECTGYAEFTATARRTLRSLSFDVDPMMHRRVRDALVVRALPFATESHWWAAARRTALAAAIVIMMAAPSVYHIVREKQRDVDDEVLLESVAANLSRGLPEALAPLEQPILRGGSR